MAGLRISPIPEWAAPGGVAAVALFPQQPQSPQFCVAGCPQQVASHLLGNLATLSLPVLGPTVLATPLLLPLALILLTIPALTLAFVRPVLISLPVAVALTLTLLILFSLVIA